MSGVPFGIKNFSKFDPEEYPPNEFYQNVQSEKLQYTIVKYLFHSEQFLKFWNEINNVGIKKSMRIIVQIGTIEATLRGKYFLENGKSVLLDKKLLLKSVKSTKFYPSDYKWKMMRNLNYKSNIKVVESDCLEEGIKLKRNKLNPCVLIMASSSHPGGGYRKGSGAQEENLFRRTNLYQCMEDPYQLYPEKSWSYPLAEFGGLYIKDSIVFREGELKGYKFMEQTESISFIASYSYSNPPTETVNNELRISSKFVKHFKKKIDAIFNIAIENGHDCIVLSAFGSGAYGVPPKHMAEIFKQSIKEIDGYFKEIVFAIYDDHNTMKDHNPEGNLKPYLSVFQ